MRSAFISAFMLLVLISSGHTQNCVECHRTVTPGIVREWELSAHSRNTVACTVCHGDAHTTASDWQEAELPTPEVCGACHKNRLEQFSTGKHAKAWGAMFAMPTAHWQPMEQMEGMKGCGGCHKLGFKTEDEARTLREQNSYGFASCDACHTRHQFSVKEAASPQACRTCHMGVDHPQWEMYSSSKHGVRNDLVQRGVLNPDTAAPACQTCHMPENNHDVRTAWGFLAVRLPMPDDEQWTADRTIIFKALGLLDPQGKPGSRFGLVAEYDLARTNQEAWQSERNRMLAVCSGCHSEPFARSELEKGDRMIREADRLMAEAIQIVAGLYTEMVVVKPEWYAYGYPDVLTFHDTPTVIEQKLFTMFHVHRMRTFQGAFHMNPDYSLWYGWSAMKQDLVEIRELAEEMRSRVPGR